MESWELVDKILAKRYRELAEVREELRKQEDITNDYRIRSERFRHECLVFIDELDIARKRIKELESGEMYKFIIKDPELFWKTIKNLGLEKEVEELLLAKFAKK